MASKQNKLNVFIQGKQLSNASIPALPAAEHNAPESGHASPKKSEKDTDRSLVSTPSSMATTRSLLSTEASPQLVERSDQKPPLRSAANNRNQNQKANQKPPVRPAIVGSVGTVAKAPVLVGGDDRVRRRIEARTGKFSRDAEVPLGKPAQEDSNDLKREDSMAVSVPGGGTTLDTERSDLQSRPTGSVKSMDDLMREAREIASQSDKHGLEVRKRQKQETSNLRIAQPRKSRTSPGDALFSVVPDKLDDIGEIIETARTLKFKDRTADVTDKIHQLLNRLEPARAEVESTVFLTEPTDAQVPTEEAKPDEANIEEMIREAKQDSNVDKRVRFSDAGLEEPAPVVQESAQEASDFMDLDEAYRVLQLPKRVTYADLVSIQATRSKLQDRTPLPNLTADGDVQQLAQLRRSQPVHPVNSHSVSFSALRNESSAQDDRRTPDVQLERVRDAHSFHHFCATKQGVQLQQADERTAVQQALLQERYANVAQEQEQANAELENLREQANAILNLRRTGPPQLSPAFVASLSEMLPEESARQEGDSQPQLAVQSESLKLLTNYQGSRFHWMHAPPRLGARPEAVRSRLCAAYDSKSTSLWHDELTRQSASLMEPLGMGSRSERSHSSKVINGKNTAHTDTALDLSSDDESDLYDLAVPLESDEKQLDSEFKRLNQLPPEEERRMNRDRLLLHRHASCEDFTFIKRAMFERVPEPVPEHLLRSSYANVLTPKKLKTKTRALTDEMLFPVYRRLQPYKSLPDLRIGEPDEDSHVFHAIRLDHFVTIDEASQQRVMVNKALDEKRSRTNANANANANGNAGQAKRVKSVLSSKASPPPQTDRRMTLSAIRKKPTPAEAALAAGRKYVLEDKKKKKTKKERRSAMARIVAINQFLQKAARRLQRSDSLSLLVEHKWMHRSQQRTEEDEHCEAIANYVRRERRPSVPAALDFDAYCRQNGLTPAEGEDNREMVRNLWNRWFDETIGFDDDDAVSEAPTHKTTQSASGEAQKSDLEGARTAHIKTNVIDFRVLDRLDAVFVGLSEQQQQQVTAFLERELQRLNREIALQGDAVRPYDIGRRGAICRKLGLLQQALSDLNKAIEVEPNFVDAYWHRHLVFFLQGAHQKALDDLSFVARNSTKHPGVHKARAQIYKLLGDVSMAIVQYSHALRQNPNDYSAFYERALLYEQRGDARLALEDYASAMKLMPTNTNAIFRHAMYYFNVGSWKEAIIGFTSVVRLEPWNAQAYFYRGRAFMKMREWTLALRDFCAVVHYDPSNWQAFYFRGCILRKAQPVRALQDLSISVLLNDTIENYNAYLHRGLLYAEVGRAMEAIADFEAVLELDRSVAAAYLNLGLIYHNMQQHLRAVKYFTSAIRVKADYLKAYMCRLEAYMKLQDYQKALLDSTRIIHMKPDVPFVYLYRGYLLLQLGKVELAGFCIVHAAEMRVILGGSPTQQALVQCFLRNYAKAIDVLKHATMQRNAPVTLFKLLGNTQMKAKSWSDAIDSFQKALETYRPWKQWEPWPQEAAEIYYLIGRCRMEMQTFAEAHESFIQAIKINQQYADAYYQRGLCKIKMKLTKLAVRDFNRALALNPDLFQVYLTRAAYYALKGRYSKAILNCNEAIALQPKSVRAYLYRGCCKFANRTIKQAIEDLNEAVKIDPEAAVVYFNRALCNHALNRRADALRDYSLVLLFNDSNLHVKIHINRGLLYLDMKDYDNALRDFIAASAFVKDDTSLLHTIGLTYQKIGNLDEAIRQFTKAIELDRTYYEAYLARGNAFMDYLTPAGLQYAKRNYEAVLRMNPKHEQARINVAYALQISGRFKHAWVQLTGVINMNSRSWSALEGRAIVNLQMRNMDGAQQDMYAAVRNSNNSNPEMLNNRGVIRELLRQTSDAMRDYQKAILVDPEYSLSYFNAANMYLKNSQFQQALEYYDRCLVLNPNDECAYANRALTKIMLAKHSEAFADFERALALAPYYAHVYFNRANLYVTVGKLHAAESDYSSALQLQPNDPTTLIKRADVRGKLGKHDEAIRDYKVAILMHEKETTSVPALKLVT